MTDHLDQAHEYILRALHPVDTLSGLMDLAAAVSAEGFADIRIDKATSSVLAIQETSGSGRPQTLRITARKSGGGTRVDAAFVVQQGQVAPEAYTRAALCRVIAGGRG